MEKTKTLTPEQKLKAILAKQSLQGGEVVNLKLDGSVKKKPGPKPLTEEEKERRKIQKATRERDRRNGTTATLAQQKEQKQVQFVGGPGDGQSRFMPRNTRVMEIPSEGFYSMEIDPRVGLWNKGSVNPPRNFTARRSHLVTERNLTTSLTQQLLQELFASIQSENYIPALQTLNIRESVNGGNAIFVSVQIWAVKR